MELEMIWDDEQVLDTGDGYIILWMDLMPLQTANFMLCIFLHKHTKKVWKIGWPKGTIL